MGEDELVTPITPEHFQRRQAVFFPRVDEFLSSLNIQDTQLEGLRDVSVLTLETYKTCVLGMQTAAGDTLRDPERKIDGKAAKTSDTEGDTSENTDANSGATGSGAMKAKGAEN